ncbi:MAG: TIGR02266 family protein [bacterium]
MLTEQRRHPRAPIYVEVRYGKVTEDVTDHILNISRSGIFIETFSPNNPETFLKISFYLPDTGHTFEITGKVAWQRTAATAEGPPGMGIEFVDISEHDANILEDFVNSVLTLD